MEMPINIKISNGEIVTIQYMTDDDCILVADLLKDNFLHSPAYRHLAPQEQDGYIALNTSEKILKKSHADTTIVCLIVLDQQGKCIGYRYTESEYLKNEQGKHAAAGKRLHVAKEYLSTDLEKHLILLSESIAKKKGFLYATAVPSNDHVHELFLSLGYNDYGKHTTDSLQRNGITREVPYMIKTL